MLNKVELIGRVGRTPEVKKFDDGGKVVNLVLATTEKYLDKSSNEKKEIVEWHRIVVKNKLTDVFEKYVNKGDLLYIEGSIRTRKYEGKDGTEKEVKEILCFEMKMLNSKKDKEGEEVEQEQEVESQEVDFDNSGDDIPFN